MKFAAYYYFVGWDCLSLGFHVCTSAPNIEIHLPFGFIRIGWVRMNSERSFGFQRTTLDHWVFGLDEDAR